MSHTLATFNDVTSGSASLDLDPLPDQTLTITARATDEAGNGSTAQRTVVIDRTAPSVTATSHAPDPFYTNGSRSRKRATKSRG